MSNIILPPDGDCAFCAYLRGDRPYTILWRTNSTAVFVTREQRGEPHLLVLPIRHAETILDLNDEEIVELSLSVKNIAKLIDQKYQKDGIAVWQNNGKAAGQAFSHVHFHVAGTLSGSGTEWGPVPELSLIETEEIAEKLRN
jgi:histidine triad (HIT) family protein